MNENILSYLMGGIGFCVALLIGILIFSEVSVAIDEAKIICEQNGIGCSKPNDPTPLIIIPIFTIVMILIVLIKNGKINFKQMLLKTGLVKLKNE